MDANIKRQPHIPGDSRRVSDDDPGGGGVRAGSTRSPVIVAWRSVSSNGDTDSGGWRSP